jgi:hypothetical protein
MSRPCRVHSTAIDPAPLPLPCPPPCRVQTPMYICGMDLAPSQGLLYMCAFSQEAGTLNMPCLNVYATGEQYSYK